MTTPIEVAVGTIPTLVGTVPVPSTAYSGAFGNAGGWGAIALVIG